MTKKKKENVSKKGSPNKLEIAVVNYYASKYIAENSTEEAISVLKDRVEEFKDPRSYKILGASYLQVNNYKDALASLYESWVLQPHDKEILDLILLAQKNIKESESIKILLKWAEEKPDGIAKYDRLAKAFYGNSKYNKAIPYLKKCIEECYPISKNIRSFYEILFYYRSLLASCYQKVHQFEMAAREYEVLMHDYPEKAERFYGSYSGVLIGLNRDDEAEDYIEKIEKPDKTFNRIYLFLGLNHAMSGNFKRAQELVVIAKDLCKSEESKEAWLISGCYYFIKGMLYWEDGNFNEVRSYLQKSERMLNRAKDSFASVPKYLAKLTFMEEKFRYLFISPDLQTLFEKSRKLYNELKQCEPKPPKKDSLAGLKAPQYFYHFIIQFYAKINSIRPLYFALTFDKSEVDTKYIPKILHELKKMAKGNSKLLIMTIEEFIISLQRYNSLDEISMEDEFKLLEHLKDAAILSRSFPEYFNSELIKWIPKEAKAPSVEPKVEPKLAVEKGKKEVLTHEGPKKYSDLPELEKKISEISIWIDRRDFKPKVFFYGKQPKVIKTKHRKISLTKTHIDILYLFFLKYKKWVTYKVLYNKYNVGRAKYNGTREQKQVVARWISDIVKTSSGVLENAIENRPEKLNQQGGYKLGIKKQLKFCIIYKRKA